MIRIKKRYDEEYIVNPVASQAGLEQWRAAVERIGRTVPPLFGQKAGASGVKQPPFKMNPGYRIDWKSVGVRHVRKSKPLPDSDSDTSLKDWLAADDGI